ncbi:phage integrase family protein [Cupriavidus sp. CP313]
MVEPLAQRLRAAGIATLGALYIASGGRWWQDLSGVGVAKATALARFVAAHADTLGPLVALVCDDAEAPPRLQGCTRKTRAPPSFPR